MSGLGTVYIKQSINNNIPSKYRYRVKNMINKIKHNELIEPHNYYSPSLRAEYKNSKGYKKIKKLKPDLTMDLLISVKIYNSNKILYMWCKRVDGRDKMDFKII